MDPIVEEEAAGHSSADETMASVKMEEMVSAKKSTSSPKYEFQAGDEDEDGSSGEDTFEDAELAWFLEELNGDDDDDDEDDPSSDYKEAVVPSSGPIRPDDTDHVVPSDGSSQLPLVEATQTAQSQRALSIDSLIQRQRAELALELRRLQFANRPVTGQTTRQNLERFFTSTNENAAAAGQVAISQPPRSLAFRSNTVQNELNQLSSEQRVGSLLRVHGPNFERVLSSQLERMAANRTSQPASRAPQEPRQPEAPTAPAPLTRATRQANEEIRVGYQAAAAQGQNTPLINAIQEHSRNQVLSEIGELIHRQMVSSTLESEFRRTLELRIVDRIRRVGNEEQLRHAMEQIARPLTRARANSNSSGGGQAPRAATRISNQSREISELKTEIGELKTLLKLSFELQLDMQRSFKQEISALVSNTFNKTDSNKLITVNSAANDKDGVCVICAESKIDTVFYQCGHMCACYKCSMHLVEQGLNCAVCRAPIKDIVRAYRCNFGEADD